MLSTNINIISQEFSTIYNYFIDFMDDERMDETFEFKFRCDFDKNICQLKHNDFIEYDKYDLHSWKPIDDQNFNDLDGFYSLPSVKMKKVRIQFPVYSLESDSNQINDYILETYTYINGIKVILDCQLINKKDTLTHKCIKRLCNEYYEYKDIWVLDPWTFCYGDEWAEFRHYILLEPTGINNTGSILSFSLTPVDKNAGIYIKSIQHNGGVNGVLLDTDKSDDMKLKMSFVNDYKYSPHISLSLFFNPIYDRITEYLAETYKIDVNKNNIYAQFEIVVKDTEDVWKQVTTEMMQIDDEWVPEYKFTRDDISFDGWQEFGPNLEFVSTINFYLHKSDIPESVSLEDYVPNEREDEYIPILYVMSDSVFITPEVFKFFVKDDIFSEKINYKNIDDMNIFNVTALNKIEKKIINVERANDYKSNIIRPVFFKTQQSGNIQIHTEVNENIAINLDSYKSKVDAFRLRLEGIDFVEVGRNNSGVIFKVIPSKLPKEETMGTYYIIDNNNELVTTGYYEYI